MAYTHTICLLLTIGAFAAATEGTRQLRLVCGLRDACSCCFFNCVYKLTYYCVCSHRPPRSLFVRCARFIKYFIVHCRVVYFDRTCLFAIRRAHSGRCFPSLDFFHFTFCAHTHTHKHVATMSAVPAECSRAKFYRKLALRTE